MFAPCRDCPSYLASAEIVRGLLLPTEIVLLNKWLSAEPVRVILFPAETFGRKHNVTDGLGRKPFFTDSSFGRKQEIADSLGEARYDGQCRQKTKFADSFIPCEIRYC